MSPNVAQHCNSKRAAGGWPAATALRVRTSDGMAGEYEELMRRATADTRVVGVVVGGSRGRGVATAQSDWDVYIFVRDDADAAEVARTLDRVTHPVEVCAVQRLSHFVSDDGVPEWNRYTFAHVAPVLDRTDGALQQACAEKERLDEATAHARAVLNLEGYVNSCYRSVKNHRDGNEAAARLDAAESINYLLEFIFADARRVRPYNKYLQWELAHHPLPSPCWSDAHVLPGLLDIVSTGTAQRQSALFGVVESHARESGHAAQLDSWGHRTLNLLRNQAP